ncbi:MAG: DUF1501 domain-containing protein [Planctomycetota bacterium]
MDAERLFAQPFQSERRRFLTSAASGLGAAALFDMLSHEAVVGAESPFAGPLTPRATHFPPKAKRCIFVYAAGGPSQLDLFDPKPALTKFHGQQLPKSVTDGTRFAFIKRDAKLLRSPRVFTRHGQCGMELSDLLPHLGSCADDIALVRSLHTEAFNHHPAQLMLSTGVPRFGRPSMGAWVVYGLGSESRNLPGYVVLSAGRGASGGTSNWANGFLPSSYQGVVLRSRGEAVLNLTRPAGVNARLQEANLRAIRELNEEQLRKARDREIQSRIESYELAFRMQSAAPELLDLSGESASTLEAYGVNRPEPTDVRSKHGGGKGVYATFARNCLLARRLVERGVRFVTLMHASWDQHGALNQELTYNARMADQPLAALLKDLKERGLLDETLVVFAGEFGRTPLAQGSDGRDHHPNAFSAWMAGGGVKGGQVVGRTDEFGWNPVEDEMHMNDFHATLLRLLGFDHTRLTKRYGGLDVRLTDVGGHVIEKLIA